MSTPLEQPDKNAGSGKKTWLKRLGLAGFLFFLIKGLVWLVVFFLAGSKVFEGCN
jgi:hypothetical protein